MQMSSNRHPVAGPAVSFLSSHKGEVNTAGKKVHRRQQKEN